MILPAHVLRISLFSLVLLAGVGCQVTDPRTPSLDLGPAARVQTSTSSDNCPAISRVAELSSLYQFNPPAAPSDETRASEAHITRVHSTCTPERENLKLDITVNFDGALGPKGRAQTGEKPSFSYPYFVAVTNSKNQILSKEIFAVNFSYDQKSNLQMQTEEFTQLVPLKGENPKTYRILIGFQLSGDELAYNRSLPAGDLGKSLTLSVKSPSNE